MAESKREDGPEPQPLPPAHGDASGAGESSVPPVRVPLVLTATLALYTAVTPITMELYVPGLPVMADYFHTGVAEMQSTIATLMVGVAVAQLLVGNVSDVLGRKNVALVGLALYCLASVSAGLAESIAQLQLQRAAQGVGAATSMVVGQALVRDVFPDQRARERITSRLSTVRALSPLLAPIVGAYLQLWFGWRSCFVVMAALGTLAIVASRSLPADRPRATDDTRKAGCAELLRACRVLVRDVRYMRLAGVDVFNFVGFFTYVTASSYVLQRHYGVPLAHFGYVYGINAAGLITGTELAPRLSRLRALGGGVASRPSAGQEGVLALGVVVSLVATCAMVVAQLTPALSVSYWSLVIPSMVYCVGRGMLTVQAIALALEGYPHLAGSATGFLFSVRAITSAVVVTGLGAVYDASTGDAPARDSAIEDASPLPLCVTMLGAQLCACAVHVGPGAAPTCARWCGCAARTSSTHGIALAEHDGAAVEIARDSPMASLEEGHAGLATSPAAKGVADGCASNGESSSGDTVGVNDQHGRHQGVRDDGAHDTDGSESGSAGEEPRAAGRCNGRAAVANGDGGDS